MATVTISKEKYRVLEKQAALYQALLKGKEEEFFPVELYTPRRIKELLAEDALDPEVRRKAKRLLRLRAR